MKTYENVRHFTLQFPCCKQLYSFPLKANQAATSPNVLNFKAYIHWPNCPNLQVDYCNFLMI